MDYIKYKKIEPAGSGLYSRMCSKIIRSRITHALIIASAAATIGLYGSNGAITYDLLNDGYSREEIEQSLDLKKESPIAKVLIKALVRNPIAKSGRNLAYFLHKNK